MIIVLGGYCHTMHGKSLVISQGFKGLFPVRKEDFMGFRRFGFNIIMQIDDSEGKIEVDDKNDKKYTSGELTKKYTPTYTNNALIYQSILKYSITFGTIRFFRTRSILIEWLLKHCPVYDEKYKVKGKTTFRNRAESLSLTITQYLDNLRYLGLIESKLVITGNKEETSEYRFTELGRLIAIVIKYSEPNLEKQKTSINEVYDQILRYYDASYGRRASMNSHLKI